LDAGDELMTPATELATRWSLRRVAGRPEWRGNCPACEYTDSFVMTMRDGKPLIWCASCGDDRTIMGGLLRGAGGGGGSPPQHDGSRQRDADAAEARKARALALWRGASPCVGSIAAIYLASRGLAGLEASDGLRFRADTPHPNGGSLPALVALVSDVAGNSMALHRTYLKPDGAAKADVDPPRAGLGPHGGGAIRLHPVAPEIVIGEGIESSASAGRLLGLPAWAAISAGNLAKTLILPPEVRSVMIAADPDPPGMKAANAAAERWRAEGRSVHIATPNKPGRDFNDLLCEASNG
jgi:putative DNA primase/helicase